MAGYWDGGMGGGYRDGGGTGTGGDNGMEDTGMGVIAGWWDSGMWVRWALSMSMSSSFYS